MKELKTPCPLCVNIKRLEAYLLAPDEVVFFDWLTVKQVAFDFVPFFYDMTRIIKETRITRRRFETITRRFEAMGILATAVKTNNKGRYKYFLMDFKSVVLKLDEIIWQEAETAKDFTKYFKELAKVQAKALISDTQTRRKEREKQQQDSERINSIYNVLNEAYKHRCDMHNKEVENGEHDKITATMLPRNKDAEKALLNLANTYDMQTINMAFLPFADMMTKGTGLKNPLAYFAQYDEQAGAFPNFDKFLCEFQNTYRH